MCISTRGDWTLGGKRARKRRKERGGEQVAMVTIKGADQTRRDEVPPPLLPSNLLHRSHRGPENRFHPTPHHFSIHLHSFARYPSGNYFWNWNDIERFIPLMSLKKWNRVRIFSPFPQWEDFHLSVCARLWCGIRCRKLNR